MCGKGVEFGAETAVTWESCFNLVDVPSSPSVLFQSGSAGGSRDAKVPQFLIQLDLWIMLEPDLYSQESIIVYHLLSSRGPFQKAGFQNLE